MGKAIVLFSGGVDSTTAAKYMLEAGWEVEALFVRYGQKHERREWGASQLLAQRFGITLKTVSIPGVSSIFGSSSLTNANTAVPHGHYEDEIQKSTIVPNRNMILVSIATAYAISLSADAVVVGCHGGDGPIYPDCRPEFLCALESAVALCDNCSIAILAPFIRNNKKQIVDTARYLNVPLELCWTCYEGGEEPCGKCGACVERIEAGG